MNNRYETKPFTLAKYNGNAYKFDGRVLFCTHLFSSGNIDHLKNNEEWSEVSVYAFDTDEKYNELYKLAENPNERINLNGD